MNAHSIAEVPEQSEQSPESGTVALASTTPDVSELFKVYKPPQGEAGGSKPLRMLTRSRSFRMTDRRLRTFSFVAELTEADFQPTTAELKVPTASRELSASNGPSAS